MRRVLPLAAVLSVVAAQPARAAFPGSDGPIAMERSTPTGATIAMVNADGTGDRSGVVAVGPDDRDATWSPDGRRLAFTSNRDGNEEIYVLDVESGAQTRLTFDAAQDHDPAWSPDGTRVAFASNRDGNPELYVMPAAGGPATRLTTDPGVDRQPAWSPGRAIAFASDRGGDLDLYVIDEQGGVPTRVTQEPGPDVDPSWSPAGSRIAFARGIENRDSDVFAIDSNGQNLQRVAGSPAFDHFPAWSPDGTRIAFASRRGFGSQIWVVPAEGEGPGRFASPVAEGTDPNWGPLPPPVGGPDVGRTITVAPADARVLVAPATSEAPSTAPALQARLRSPSEVPVGTTINAALGTVAVEAVTTTPDGPGTVGRAEVTGGVFTVSQRGAGEPTLRLLPGIRPCQRARASRVPPEARMRINARGRFRTIGGYGRAAGRGTEWAVRERCDGTVFQVFEGLVLVHDYRRRRTMRVRAGRCYLAAVRQRPDALRPARRCPRVRSRR